ncbi:MAG: flagellar hook-associated protein FlgK [Bdellovibrionales bacterium]
MSLTALNTALSGLRASQNQINVISNNVANASTPGYSRKLAPQSTATVDGVGIGVRSENILRQVDLNLERDLWTQISAVGELDIKRSYLQRIEQFHGPPDAEISISAELARLEDTFSNLSQTPEDPQKQAIVVNQAIDVANKINNFADLIQTSRNDAQDEIEATVTRINDLLVQIANVNDEIQEKTAFNDSTATLADARDEAIKELSGLIDISFFTRGDGVLVVQTNRGIELTSNFAQQLTFRPSPLGPGSLYPDGAAGIFVGDPLTTSSGAIEITQLSPGGKLGGLIELRDETFPKQRAQLDEFSHKLALRFEAQGLRLFTDESGGIPADTPPTPEVIFPIPAPAIAVEYIGFSSEITVNQNVINNNALVQQGTATTDVPVQEGSNEVIRRIIEYTFGNVSHQEAIGSIDLRVGGAATSLQEWLGIYSDNQITTSRDIVAFGDLTLAAGSPFATPGADTFSITIDPAGEGVGPTGPLNIDINALPLPRDAAQLANAITALDPDITASVNSNGQLEIQSRWDLQIDDVNLGTPGFQFLGINPGSYEATDPFIDVQVGNQDPVRIVIEPGDTEVQFIDKLILDPTIPNDQGVPGLAFDAVEFAASGNLILRAGDDFNNPEFGGDIKITTGISRVDGANAEINVLTPGTLIDGVNAVSAIFGSFSATGQDFSPVTESQYQSETETGSGIFVSFRQNLLGSNLGISTNITGATTLSSYAQRIINENTQELILTDNRIADEETLQDVLQTQLFNESGVNIDEELGNLIKVQTAYSAAARVVTAVDELFQELLNAVR